MAWGMGAMAQQVCVVLSTAEREQLAAIVADRNRRRKHVERAGIVLASADRHSAQQVAQRISVSRPTVWRWQQRFAALSVLDGTVIGRCMQRHRHLEFVRFLNAVERRVPAGKVIHAVLDNYATHKHPRVLAWLARHPRWTFHFTPTSASWLNAVENFFSKMTRQRIRRGVFRSIADLQAAINAYLAEHNASPKPFVWTQSAEAIMAKLERCPVLSV
jgi:transposase